jgi:hypothetical protein
MNTKTIVAVILLIFGIAIVMLGYSGIALMTPGEGDDFRDLHFLQTTHNYFIPQAVAALALIGCGGIVLLVVKTRQV